MSTDTTAEWWRKPVVSRYQMAIVFATWMVLELIKVTWEHLK